jgi:hypothetical protein
LNLAFAKEGVSLGGSVVVVEPVWLKNMRRFLVK